MRKRKVLAVFISAILALSLTACGTVTVTTAQPEPQPAAEVETPTPTPVEGPEVTPEPTKEPEEEVVEEPATEEPATEKVATEEPETPVEEITPMDALLNSNMGEYISDGVFNFDKFIKDTNAYGSAVTEGTLALIYDGYDGHNDWWFLEAGEENNTGFVAIGTWNSAAPDGERANLYTYSYTFSMGDDVNVSDGDASISVPVECIIHLQDVIDSVNKSGPKVIPDTVGTEFKPCEPEDATTQY